MTENIKTAYRSKSLGSVKTSIGELIIFDFSVRALLGFTSDKKDDLRNIIPYFCFPKESIIEGKYKPDKPVLSSENTLLLTYDDLETISKFCIKYFKFLHFQDHLPDKKDDESYQDCLKRKLNSSNERLLSIQKLTISETTYLNDALNKYSSSFQTRLAKPLQESISKIQNYLSANNLSHMAGLQESIDKMLIPINNISNSLNKSLLLLKDRLCPPKEFFKMKSVMDDYTLSYKDLAVSLKTPEDITKLPNFAFQNATQELLLTVHAFETLSKPQVENAKIGGIPPYIDSSLRDIDPELADIRIGAYDALNSNNPDKKRHALVSLRMLFDGLLNSLAPNGKVLEWASQQDEKRSFRQNQIAFLCRNIKSERYMKFVENDTEALIKLRECLELLHIKSSEISQEQLWALLLRFDSWIIAVLDI